MSSQKENKTAKKKLVKSNMLKTSALDSALVQKVLDDIVNAGGVRLKQGLENPLEPTTATPSSANPYGPTGRMFPKAPGGADANPLPGEPMPPQTSTVKQEQNPTETRS